MKRNAKQPSHQDNNRRVKRQARQYIEKEEREWNLRLTQQNLIIDPRKIFIQSDSNSLFPAFPSQKPIQISRKPLFVAESKEKIPGKKDIRKMKKQFRSCKNKSKGLAALNTKLPKEKEDMEGITVAPIISVTMIQKANKFML